MILRWVPAQKVVVVVDAIIAKQIDSGHIGILYTDSPGKGFLLIFVGKDLNLDLRFTTSKGMIKDGVADFVHILEHILVATMKISALFKVLVFLQDQACFVQDLKAWPILIWSGMLKQPEIHRLIFFKFNTDFSREIPVANEKVFHELVVRFNREKSPWFWLFLCVFARIQFV